MALYFTIINDYLTCIFSANQTSLEQPLPMSLPPLISSGFGGGEGYPPGPPGGPGGPSGPPVSHHSRPLSPDISPSGPGGGGGGGGFPGGEEGIGVW